MSLHDKYEGCTKDTCFQGSENLRSGHYMLDFNGRVRVSTATASPPKYIDATVKCSTLKASMETEIETLKIIGPHKNVLHYISDTIDSQMTIVGAPSSKKYFISAFESAPGSWSEILDLCFKEKGTDTSPSWSMIRSVCRGVIAGVKHFHNQGYTVGMIKETNVRFIRTPDDNVDKIRIKLTDLMPQKRTGPLNGNTFKMEVLLVADILKGLVYRGKTGFNCENGNRELYDNMLDAMLSESLSGSFVHVPSLELVSTCFFLMSDSDRASFILLASISLKADSAYIGMMLRDNPRFSRCQLW